MKNRTVLGFQLIALLEVASFLTLLFFIDVFFCSGTRFVGVSPHPLWIILLLVLFQYSIREAILTIALMCAFLYVGNLPPQNAAQSLFDYYFSLALNPIMWLGMTILLGGLRLRSNSKAMESQKELKRAFQKERVISESYERLKGLNRALELRLSEELGSAIKIYRAAVTLEEMGHENQMDGLTKIVASILAPEKFSIFIKSEEGLVLRSSYAWSPDDKFSKKFHSGSSLCKAITGEKRILSVASPGAEAILGSEGVLAGPLTDNGSGEVFGMLKIEAMSFQTFNLRTLQLFKLLCEWTGVTMKKMQSMKRLASESISSQTQAHRSYSYAFLQAQTDFLEALARRIGFHLTKLSIRLVNAAELNDEEHRQASVAMALAIKGALRKTDLLFDAKERGDEYALLLCGTGEENVGIVIKKIQENLAKSGGSEQKAKYSFASQALFRSERNPSWEGPK